MFAKLKGIQYMIWIKQFSTNKQKLALLITYSAIGLIHMNQEPNKAILRNYFFLKTVNIQNNWMDFPNIILTRLLNVVKISTKKI